MSKPSNSGVIVALLPSTDYTALRPTIHDHHCTVAFLGRHDDEGLNEKALKAFWKSLTSVWEFALDAQVTAESAFWTGPDDGWARVDLIDSPYLSDFRSTVQELLEVHDLPLSRRHGFLPHITKRYNKSPNDQTIVHTKAKPRFSFDRVALWAGDFRLEKGLA